MIDVKDLKVTNGPLNWRSNDGYWVITVCSTRCFLTIPDMAASMFNNGKLFESCSWSAEQEKCFFPSPRPRLRIWSRETGSAVPSRVFLLISILRLNMVLTGFLHIQSFAAASIYLFKTSRRHRVSPEFIGSRNGVPMAVTAESLPVQG